MFSKLELEHLKELVRTEAGATGKVLGARLGEIIRDGFPDRSIKSEYKTLGRFVKEVLPNFLVIAGRHGQDNQYSLHTGDAIHPQGNVPSISKPAVQVSDDETTIRLRSAIKAAVDELSLEQLRSLVIPAGVLFDAFNKTSSL